MDSTALQALIAEVRGTAILRKTLARTFRRAREAQIETRSIEVCWRLYIYDVRKRWRDHGGVHWQDPGLSFHPLPPENDRDRRVAAVRPAVPHKDCCRQGRSGRD